MVFDAVSRAEPSSVFGPVERPPWSLQRPFFLVPGRWHNVPRRVRAMHLMPCQLGPYSHGLELLFITLKLHRFLGFYNTAFWIALLGMRD